MLQYKQKKYKTFLKLRDVFKEKKRILKFKRPKWNLVKTLFAKKFAVLPKAKRGFKIKLPFYNQTGVVIPARWSYLRAQYKEAIFSKRKLYYFYLIKTRLSVLKNKLLRTKSLELFLLGLEYRLDIALWRAGFFGSPAIARFFIIHKNVFINGQIIALTSYILKEGDIINFTQFGEASIYLRCINFISFISVKKKGILQQAKIEFVCPFFLEINWNILSIAVICSENKEHITKLPYIYNTNLNLPNIRNYLRKI